MFSRDSQGVGQPGVVVQVGLCAIVALLFSLGGDRFIGIERGFYDLAQRLSAGPARAPVVIVSPDDSSGDLWNQARFDELITALKAAGAKALIPASPARASLAKDDVVRLKSLIRLEQSGSALRSQAEPGVLQGQLAAAEQHLSQQQRVADAIRAAGNVVIGLATTERRPGSDPVPDACAKRIAAGGQRFTEPDVGSLTPVALAPVAEALCAGAAAISHMAHMTDRDGVVRRPAPVLMTPPGPIPSAAIAALDASPADANATGKLSRFYQSADGSGGFKVVAATEILNGRALDTIRDQYVVIGKPAANAGDEVSTPISQESGSAILIATELANQLSHEHIARPAWAGAVEIGLAVVLAIVVVMVGQLSLTAASLAAISGMTALLVAEYVLIAAGMWLHLAGLALFCLTGVALLHVVLQFFGSRTGPRATAAGADGMGLIASGEELDLGFSVLRQQPTTDRTKQQLYELAMEHGKKRDYAKAERVFRHLAARDPGYRDVAAKLEKLSGARGVAAPKTPTGRVEPAFDSPPAAASPAGRTLGRYELDRVIGRGAMATVYLGRDPTINRRVAIKTLPLAEEFADSDLAAARSNFLREAESAGRLNHQYIISIHDAGEDNRVAYLAMEYFEGKPLSHYAQLGRLLPPKVVFELMARAAEALHYAHSQNVVHRDVKPANLMYDIANDRLKLTDFGIARLTDASRTRTGIILGTPSYMSPEQLSASNVSGQTDIYSLGVTMYHLLTGAPPFQADSIPRLMDKIVHQQHRPIADIRDDVPPCADVILARALAKNPEDRYESGKAMALALRECCSTFPTETL